MTVDVGCLWRQEVPLQLVLQQHVVLGRKAQARSEKDKAGDCYQLLSPNETHK